MPSRSNCYQNTQFPRHASKDKRNAEAQVEEQRQEALLVHVQRQAPPKLRLQDLAPLPGVGHHMLRRRSQKMKRNARGTTIMAGVDARIVKKFLPYE